MIPLENIGLDLAVIGSVISIIGVLVNNIFLNHIQAMQIWCISNILLMVYFYGNYRHWWDCGLSALTLCMLYAVMLVTGVWGLMQG